MLDRPMALAFGEKKTVTSITAKLSATMVAVVWGKVAEAKGQVFDFGDILEEAMPARSVMLLQSLSGTGEMRVTS
jgi:hypothetical protein